MSETDPPDPSPPEDARPASPDADAAADDLDGAYAIRTPDEARAYYAGWAARYDSGFAVAMGYDLPRAVAAVFARAGGCGPVLDAGAGTGLVGAALAAAGIGPCDALDLTPEMLAVAAGKGVYRDLIRADLTGPLPLGDAIYRGVVSSGTFTHGHVGPVALVELLRVAAPGALFCLSVNAGVWDGMGFAAALDALDGRIAGPVERVEVPVYRAADPAHAADRAFLVLFRSRG